jgi:hypothetical protein
MLAQDTSAESSASAAAASNQFALCKSKNIEENVYQIQLINTIKILIRQSSKTILKVNKNLGIDINKTVWLISIQTKIDCNE